MATFLKLTQDLARESGTLAGGVTLVTVAGVTGRADKLASWIRKAWVNMQNERADWPWMRAEFTSALTIGQKRYTAAQLGITERFGLWVGDAPDFRTFTLYDPALGVADEGEIRQIDYRDWRVRYDRGAQEQNRPTDWAVSNAQELCVGATPDKAYVMRGEYRKAPQVLTESNDEPELPEQYHGAIVWEALKLLGLSDESPATSTGAISEYILARQNLNRDYLPEVRFGEGPLA